MKESGHIVAAHWYNVRSIAKAMRDASGNEGQQIILVIVHASCSHTVRIKRTLQFLWFLVLDPSE
jgi:hypothetical protein